MQAGTVHHFPRLFLIPVNPRQDAFLLQVLPGLLLNLGKADILPFMVSNTTVLTALLSSLLLLAGLLLRPART
jgi:hypothetical protein